jgi:hypothetical protein
MMVASIAESMVMVVVESWLSVDMLRVNFVGGGGDYVHGMVGGGRSQGMERMMLREGNDVRGGKLLVSWGIDISMSDGI